MRQFSQNVQNRPVGACHHIFDYDTSEDRHCLLSWKHMNFRQKVFHSSATPSYSNVTSIGLQSTPSLGCEIVQRKGPPWHWDIVTDTKKSHTWTSTAFWEILIKRGKCKKQTHTQKTNLKESRDQKGWRIFSSRNLFLFPLAKIQPMKSNGLLKLHPSDFLFPHKGVLSISAGNSQGGRRQIAVLFIINLFMLEKQLAANLF